MQQDTLQRQALGKRLSPLAALLLFMLTSLCPCALTADQRPFTIRQATLNKQVYLLMEDVASFYRLRHVRKDKKYCYVSPATNIMLTPDVRTATVGDVDVILGFAPMVHQGKLYLSRLDFSTFIDPVLRPSTLPRRNVQRIVIDPGHGGKDPGCRSSSNLEKTINLAIALKLAQELKKRGYTVAMTRMSDIYLPLSQRVALAKRFKPDLFISLHCNAAGAAARGVEVYAATPQNSPASDSKVLARKACAASPYDKTNSFVAYHVQRQLVSLLKMPDRASRRKRYNVIADLPAPAILIEMGFLTNASDRALLTTGASQNQFATAIANAVGLYRLATAFPKKP